MQQNTIFKSQQTKQSNTQYKDFMFLCLRKWYWFVLSVAVCASIAYVYGKSANYIYQANALIMIKSEPQKGGGMSESAIFSDIGISSGNNQVEGEMYMLRSTGIMKTVVQRLGLDVSYSVKPMLRVADIYGANPIAVVFADKSLTGNFSFQIDDITESGYKYIIVNEEKNSKWEKAQYGDTISTTYGRFVVDKSPFFGNGFTKEVITVILQNNDIVADRLLANLSLIRTDRVTNALTLTLKDANIKRAKDVLNTLIEVYNEDVISDKNKIANNTEKFIVERIAAISEDLGGIDTQIEVLKKENKITDFGSTSSILLQTGSRYKDEVVRLGTEISVAQFVKDYLSDPQKKSELIPANTGITDIGIENQITKYNEGQLQLNKLLANSGPSNPVTIELSNNLNVSKANMIRSIDNYLSSLYIKRNEAVGQENIANRRIASVPTQEKQVNDVVRQQKIKEELYLYLLNKREENALKLAITESNAKIIEFARGSEFPISPNMPIYLLISLVTGLLFPIIVIVIIKWIYSLDSTVHNKQDVEELTSIPVLGEIPQKSKQSKDDEIIISETGRDRISEAFRMVRSNMDYIFKKSDNSAKVIQITSTFPGEGKSYVTVNLALSYAQTGKKVLLVDLDMRKGKLSRLLDAKHTKGMSDFLSGQVTDKKLIVSNSSLSPTLAFISSGILPPNPANLLMSDRFESLVAELKTDYDYIFLDTVPFSVVADAKLINRVADVTLYVIRDGKLEKGYLSELDRIYTENTINNLIALVVDVNVDHKRYGYGYSYGYGYIEGEESNEHPRNSRVKKAKK